MPAVWPRGGRRLLHFASSDEVAAAILPSVGAGGPARDQARLETGDAFGAVLRRFRVRAGLSQEELAARAGLSARAIGTLEQGLRRRPYPHTVSALADALELAPAELDELLESTRAGERVSPVPRRARFGQSAVARTARGRITAAARLVDLVRRPRGGSRERVRAARSGCVAGAAADTARPGRGRQDAAGRGGGGSPEPCLHATASRSSTSRP